MLFMKSETKIGRRVNVFLIRKFMIIIAWSGGPLRRQRHLRSVKVTLFQLLKAQTVIVGGIRAELICEDFFRPQNFTSISAVVEKGKRSKRNGWRLFFPAHFGEVKEKTHQLSAVQTLRILLSYQKISLIIRIVEGMKEMKTTCINDGERGDGRTVRKSLKKFQQNKRSRLGKDLFGRDI